MHDQPLLAISSQHSRPSPERLEGPALQHAFPAKSVHARRRVLTLYEPLDILERVLLFLRVVRPGRFERAADLLEPSKRPIVEEKHSVRRKHRSDAIPILCVTRALKLSQTLRRSHRCFAPSFVAAF